MTTERPTSSSIAASITIAIAITVGLIVSAFLLSGGLADIRKSERYVTVRGVAERDVKADLAVWPLKVRVLGNDLTSANEQLDIARVKVLKFLTDNGLPEADIARQEVRVQDRFATDYGNNKPAMRYLLEATLAIRSKDVDKVQKASQLTSQLVSAGIVLTSGAGYEGGGPQYLFTGLNSVKPTMMAEATKSAREGANKFAADSGSKVGAIRRATQGLFTINERDQSSAGGEGGGGDYGRPSDVNKRVRVVVTVDYALDN